MSPDLSPEPVYTAIGRAMTAWESLEANFSYLFSILTERPMLLRALEDYGRDVRIFDGRMKLLWKASESYFRKSPSQDREAKLDRLIADARALSIYRNHIAHGMVQAIQTHGDNRDKDGWTIPFWSYRLIPSWHAQFHLIKNTGMYYYGSSNIDEHTKSFVTLAQRVRQFNDTLNPPSH